MNSASLIFLEQYIAHQPAQHFCQSLCYDLLQLHVLQLLTWMAAGVCNVTSVLRVQCLAFQQFHLCRLLSSPDKGPGSQITQFLSRSVNLGLTFIKRQPSIKFLGGPRHCSNASFCQCSYCTITQLSLQCSQVSISSLLHYTT